MLSFFGKNNKENDNDNDNDNDNNGDKPPLTLSEIEAEISRLSQLRRQLLEKVYKIYYIDDENATGGAKTIELCENILSTGIWDQYIDINGKTYWGDNVYKTPQEVIQGNIDYHQDEINIANKTIEDNSVELNRYLEYMNYWNNLNQEV